MVPVIVSYSVLSRHSARVRRLATALLVASICVSAHALERVTLRNGFSYDCSRQEALDDTHIRLFLTPSTLSAEPSTANFIDLPTQSIAATEILPDPVPALPAAAPATPPAAVVDIPTLLAAAGTQHNIDAELLASIVHTESGFRANAVSRTGARGLMQLMPGTAQQLGVADSFQPSQNIAGGSTYFDDLLTRYHDNLALALAAYNAGPAAVDRYHGIPPYRETRAYVARVMLEFKHRKQALEHQHQHTPANSSQNSAGVILASR
jgi:soluble lytic murein transglycosylase-like protein